MPEGTQRQLWQQLSPQQNPAKSSHLLGHSSPECARCCRNARNLHSQGQQRIGKHEPLNLGFLPGSLLGTAEGPPGLPRSLQCRQLCSPRALEHRPEPDVQKELTRARGRVKVDQRGVVVPLGGKVGITQACAGVLFVITVIELKDLSRVLLHLGVRAWCCRDQRISCRKGRLSGLRGWLCGQGGGHCVRAGNRSSP